MKLYIVFIESKTYREILGVFSTKEKAETIKNKFLEWAGHSFIVQSYIIEKTLDEKEKNEL